MGGTRVWPQISNMQALSLPCHFNLFFELKFHCNQYYYFLATWCAAMTRLAYQISVVQNPWQAITDLTNNPDYPSFPQLLVIVCVVNDFFPAPNNSAHRHMLVSSASKHFGSFPNFWRQFYQNNRSIQSSIECILICQ